MREENSYPTHILWFLGICALALGVRELVYLVGQYNFINGDEYFYLRFARNINAGREINTWFWLPGWPVLLAFFLKLGGVFAGRQATMVFASVSCGIVYLMGERLWGHRIGLICGILLSFLPEHVIFSHLVYAEIGLELIIVFFSLMLLYAMSSRNPHVFLVPGFLVLGLGMLYKHFVVFPFAASLLAFFFREKRRLILPYGSLFFLPLFLFSIYLKTKNVDPLFWLDSPLKSAQEWQHLRVARHFKVGERENVLKSHFEFLREIGPVEFVQHSGRNFQNLWMVNKYVTSRLERYPGLPILEKFKILVGISYWSVLILALYGFLKSLPSLFYFYALITLGALTSAGLFVFMVPRYHVPFLFFLVLFAGFGIERLRAHVWGR